MIFGWFQVGPMVALVGRQPGGVICIGGRVTHPATNHISIILLISLFLKRHNLSISKTRKKRQYCNLVCLFDIEVHSLYYLFQTVYS